MEKSAKVGAVDSVLSVIEVCGFLRHLAGFMFYMDHSGCLRRIDCRWARKDGEDSLLLVNINL